MSQSVLDPIINESGKSYGINSADELVKAATSDNKNSQRDALRIYDDITNKIIQQNITSTTILNGIYNLPYLFQGNRLIGNGTEYVHMFPQGSVYPFTLGGYLPSHVDKTTQKLKVARYDRKPVTQIISDPVKVCIKMTITRAELLSRMVSVEKLEQLVAETITTFEKEMILYLAHKVFKLITNATYSKVINDDSDDCYAAWTKFGEIIKKSETFRNDFVIDQTAYPNVGNTWLKDDKLIFMSAAVYTKYTLGLKPVVFNNKDLALDRSIDPNNIYILPDTQYINDYKEQNGDTPQFVNTPYIDDKTIICISKYSVSYKVQVDMYDEQYFANNSTDFYQKNLWYVLDMVKFTNGFKFISDNLTTLPQDTDEQQNKKVSAKSKKN